jgi:hypothetical protein
MSLATTPSEKMLAVPGLLARPKTHDPSHPAEGGQVGAQILTSPGPPEALRQ